MENKVKYKERKKLSIVLEKLIVSTTKVLLVIVTFLFLSTVYKYTLSRQFYLINTAKNSIDETIKKDIDEIGRLKGNSKYSKADIDELVDILNNEYNYLYKISKLEECTKCTYLEYVNLTEKNINAVDSDTRMNVIKRLRKINYELYSKNLAFFLTPYCDMPDEIFPFVSYGKNKKSPNKNFYRFNSRLLRLNFSRLIDDIYEEVNRYE